MVFTLVRYESLIGQHLQEVYEFFKELDEMNWSTLGNVLHQYLRNTLIGTTVIGVTILHLQIPSGATVTSQLYFVNAKLC